MNDVIMHVFIAAEDGDIRDRALKLLEIWASEIKNGKRTVSSAMSASSPGDMSRLIIELSPKKG